MKVRVRRQIATKHLVSAAALVVVTIVSVAYIYGGVLQLSLTHHPKVVTVELDKTGGLFARSGVTYRGVRVGTVKSVRLNGDGVQVTANLSSTRKIPADSTFVVRSLSPAGEQFLDIQPQSAGPPYLRSGAHIDKERTATPTSVAKTIESVDRLVGQVNEKDLSTILRELSVAFKDPEDLRGLLTNAQSLLTTINDVWPETLDTLENGKVVLRTGVDKTDQFEQFASNSKDLAAFVRGYDPHTRKILDEAPGEIGELRALVSEVALRIPTFLDNGLQLTTIVAGRNQQIRALLKDFEPGFRTFADILKGGRFRVNIWVSPGSVCDYGNPAKGLPRQTVRTPVNMSAMCSGTFDGLQRGAAHVPPPTK